MTKTNKKYNECEKYTDCSHLAAKNVDEKETINYGFYSKVLQKPFDSLSELKAAEDVYYAEQKAKADKKFIPA